MNAQRNRFQKLAGFSDRISQKKGLIDLLPWLIWAVGFALCFPTYNLSFLVWIIFIPVLIYAYTQPIRKTVVRAFLFSLILWWGTTYWLIAFHEAALPFVAPGYSMYNAFFFLVIAYIGQKMKKWRWIATPSIWVMNELLRSSGYVGFKWNLIGDALFRNVRMIQTADIWGSYGISFLVILVNAVLVEIILSWVESKDWKKVFAVNKIKIGFAGILLLFSIIYGFVQYNHYRNMSDNAEKETLALLQPNIGSFEPWYQNLDLHYTMLTNLHHEAAQYDPDIIVWSETIIRHSVRYYWTYEDHENYINQFNEKLLSLPFDLDIPILVTYPDRLSDKIAHNTATFINPDVAENPIDFVNNPIYAKIHLVPFGEWMPYYEKIPVARDILKQAGAAAYSPGEEFLSFESRNAEFGVLICFEDVFAILAREFIKRNRINYFLNTTNDGWAYRWEIGTSLPLWQHVAAATLTSVAVRRPIARAVNTGVTCVIDVTGDISVSDIGLYERGYFIEDIAIIDADLESPFVQGGYLFPYLAALFTVVLFAVAVFSGKGELIEQ